MTKGVKIIFDEIAGEASFIDMSGYNGDDCKKELERLKKFLLEEGIEINGDVKKKAPQIPIRNKITQKVDR